MQWHPERTCEQSEFSRAIFSAFREAAGEWHTPDVNASEIAPPEANPRKAKFPMTGEGASSRLNDLLQKAGLEPVDDQAVAQFEAYISLFVRWNTRINLSSVRDEEGILSRHIVESIVVARSLPDQIATLLDFGSGGGLPGIPIALCRRPAFRNSIAVTLAESNGKKAAFLQEAVRVLGIPGNGPSRSRRSTSYRL